MGVSTDAMLVFGIDLDEDGGQFEDQIDRELNIPDYGSPDRPSYEEIKKMENDFPVTIVKHCSGECPMYIVAIPGTLMQASRGYPRIIDGLEVSAEKVEKFKAWCAKNGIEDEPTWLLASMWN